MREQFRDEGERKVDDQMLRRKNKDMTAQRMRTADGRTLDYFPRLTVLSGFHGNSLLFFPDSKPSWVRRGEAMGWTFVVDATRQKRETDLALVLHIN